MQLGNRTLFGKGAWENRYATVTDLKTKISIHIGEFYSSADPVVIHTLLGSCVAVCLFDPVKKIGAMNHILLPGRANMKHFDAPARFGINAMELLINGMMNLGLIVAGFWQRPLAEATFYRESPMKTALVIKYPVS